MYLEIPQTASELTLDAKLEFNFTNFRIAEWMAKKRKDPSEYCNILAKGISLVLNKDLGEILMLDGSSILNMDYTYFHEHLEQLSGKLRKNIKIEDLENSLTEIWIYLENLIADAKPNTETKTFEYKGETYTMPSYIFDDTGKIISHESISYQQATKCMAINNNYAYQVNEAIKHDPEIERSDANKNFIFKRLIEEIVMLTWDQDKIPIDTTQFEIQFKQKIKHFYQIDYQSVINIDYWFQTYIEELEKDKRNRYFFESTYEPESPEEKLAFEKAKLRGANILYHIGEESLTPRLIETGAFNIPGLSSRESLYRSPFTDVVRFQSADNSNK